MISWVSIVVDGFFRGRDSRSQFPPLCRRPRLQRANARMYFEGNISHANIPLRVKFYVHFVILIIIEISHSHNFYYISLGVHNKKNLQTQALLLNEIYILSYDAIFYVVRRFWKIS